jgi:intraflagellar transport protein 81
MAGLDSEAVALDQEVKGYRKEITANQSKLHLLNTSLAFKDASNERVAQEMKAYIGGDDVIEAQQRARGFKTYRDMYMKRIQELEISGKKRRESQKAIKASHEPNLKQLEYFEDLKKLLGMKIESNKMVLKNGGRSDGYEGSEVMVRDRLVL